MYATAETEYIHGQKYSKGTLSKNALSHYDNRLEIGSYW